MSAEEIYKEALLSISKNTCCDLCREAALVAKTALDTVESQKTAANSAMVPCCLCGESVIINKQKYHCQKCFDKLTVAQHQ